MSNYPDKEWMDYVLSQLLDAIKCVETYQDSQHEEIRLLLIQTVEKLNRVEAKVDAMENRLLPPGYAFIQKPSEITPAGQVKRLRKYLEAKP